MDQRMHLRSPYHHQQQGPPRPRISTSSSNIVTYAQQQLGVSVAAEKRKAFALCKSMVERIAAQCRKKNRRFRDIDFDVENDRNKCLHNLVNYNTFTPSDTRRITELLNKPKFYSGGLRAAEVVQGSVEDCYLVSALSGLTALPKLVEELCVARDDEIGVYGFIFYRDCYWVPVVIDDIVFTRIPRFEQLSAIERELWQFDKNQFNDVSRQAIDSLYFAKAGKTGDTWVPLVEKAFAKLNGDYASIMFGRTCDAIEDITGGISSLTLTKDILDIDKFWNEELLNANKDRIFACWFKAVEGVKGAVKNITVDGLIGNLSHSVVRAVECRGRRFVILRDPWGEAGWKGPWSDGSKEWTTDWLENLVDLGHTLEGTGQFVMEYKDFLNTWQEVQRTLIFDDSWIMSSQWLHLPEKVEMAPWNYGDFTFTFSLPVASRTIISLTKVNPRFFKDIQGAYLWNLDFILAKEGETEPIGESSYSFFYTRSVSLEMDLEAGNYVVLARLDPSIQRDKDYFKKGLDSGWDRRKLGKVLTERAKSWSIAANYKPDERLVIKPVSDVLGGELAKADKVALDTLKTYGSDLRSSNASSGEGVTVTTTTTTQTVVSRKTSDTDQAEFLGPHTSPHPPRPNTRAPSPIRAREPARPPAHDGYYYVPQGYGQQYAPGPSMEPGWVGEGQEAPSRGSSPGGMNRNVYGIKHPHPSNPDPRDPLPSPLPPPPPPPPPGPTMFCSPPPFRVYTPPPLSLPNPLMGERLEDDNAIAVGLKVYTKGSAPTVITGRLNLLATGPNRK